MVFLTLLSDDLGCLEVVFKRTSLRLRSGYPFNVHYLTDGKSNFANAFCRSGSLQGLVRCIVHFPIAVQKLPDEFAACLNTAGQQ